MKRPKKYMSKKSSTQTSTYAPAYSFSVAPNRLQRRALERLAKKNKVKDNA